MQLIIKPIGETRAPRRSRIKQRGHVYIDGPVPMRKAEMGAWRTMEARLAKTLTHLYSREVGERREWYRNVFMKKQPPPPTEREMLDAITKSIGGAIMEAIPPEDLPRA